MSNDTYQESIRIIIRAWRQGRPIVPFVGAGVSVAAGYPNITRLTGYLAKVQFALEKAIYQSRYPIISDGIDTAVQRYIRCPSDFITDFGWPELGQLNADLWSWITNTDLNPPHRNNRFVKDQAAAVQEILVRRLSDAESAVVRSLPRKKPILAGDWSGLLNHLTEGQMDLVDALFTGLDQGRTPTRAQLFLTYLTQMLGIRLILTTNFDSLIEAAMHQEGLYPKVFDVHRDADLPHARLIRSQFSIVKLAGSAYGLRFGEKLQYALEAEAQRRIHEYIPDNCLIVVMGFSGWERRMMQVIGDFARRQAGTSGQTQVLWLTDVPKYETHSPQLVAIEDELAKRGRSQAIHRAVISDLNAFLPGLYFSLTSGFPPSQQRYGALVPFPPLPRPIDGQSTTFFKISPPALLIFADSKPEALDISNDFPSSWPSLAAAQCASEYRSHRHIIWIDLENHYTVESVVQDVLSQIRHIDPAAPRLMLPSEPSPSQVAHDLVKVVERIREALQRGVYMIVLDSLESFGRPHFVHHGFPQRNQQLDASNHQTKRLCDLICLLLGRVEDKYPSINPPLHDTLVLLSVSRPTPRHNGDNPVMVKTLETVKELLTVRLSKEALEGIRVRHGVCIQRTDFIREVDTVPVWSIRTLAHSKAARKRLDSCSELSVDKTPVAWIKFVSSVGLLRRTLRDSRNESDLIAEGETLLSLLSYFRRPRPISLIRSVLLRWLFDPGDMSKVSATLECIDKTLKLLEGENLIERFEDGTVWMPRQLHDPLYESLTSKLRLTQLSDGKILGDYDASSVILLSSLVSSMWHLQAARSYFADVYLATHDEQAFFEFMYHRVSAMRYLVLAQVTCEESKTAADRLSHIENLLETESGHGADGESIGCWTFRKQVSENPPDNQLIVANLLAVSFPRLSQLLYDIGAFSEVRRDPLLTEAMSDLQRIGQKDVDYVGQLAVSALRIAVFYLRRHSLETLGNAFIREHNRISATTTPDTWLGWIGQLLEAELPEIGGRWSVLRGIERVVRSFPEIPLCNEPESLYFDNAYNRLEYNLIALKLRLLRQKLDYSIAKLTASQEICRLSSADSADIHERIKMLAAWSSSQGTMPPQWNETAELIRDTAARSVNIDRCHHLLRCWIEYCRALDGEGHHDDAVELLKHVESQVRTLFPETGEAIMRELYPQLAYEVRHISCELRLHYIPMWHAFDIPATRKHQRPVVKRLKHVEMLTHELEDITRTLAPSAIDYATRRSLAYSMRARALYLRSQFREAHRVLSLALSDIGNRPDESRFARAIVHLYRAELHTISANAHLSAGGNPVSSHRKLETGLECLAMAAKTLEPAAHQAIWWLRIHLGRAQIRHEQILLFVRQLSNAEFTENTGYARMSLWLEECVLDGLRSLRIALDTLPFNDKMSRLAKTERDRLAQIEEKLLALWIQLFVSSFACNHLMLARLQMPSLVPPEPALTGWCEYFSWTDSAIRELRDSRVVPLSLLFSPHGFWAEKWRPWCEMSQFYYFARYMKDLVSDEVVKKGEIVAKRGIIARRIRELQLERGRAETDMTLGFREELLMIESQLIGIDELHLVLWNWRRNECKVQQES